MGHNSTQAKCARLKLHLPEANTKNKVKRKKEKNKEKNLQAEFRDMNSIYKWFEDE